MMRFFHSFPRPREGEEKVNTTFGRAQLNEAALTTLESILRYGLLCTPEWLHVYSAPNTDDEDKRELLSKGEPEYSHSQSRFCVTLCEPQELFERKVRGPSPTDELKSHADLFGPWAIGFDPVVARRIGFAPTNYFSPTNISGEGAVADRSLPPGLSMQMIQRLKELRELLIVMARIEAGLDVSGYILPDQEMISAVGLNLPFEQKIVSKIRRMSAGEREAVFELLNIDRESAFNLVGFLEMMLSLFQQTDSIKEATPFAFYQQREWRLIHHMRVGTRWYCLGKQPLFRDGNAPRRQPEIRNLREIVAGGRSVSEDYFKSCWLLEQVDGQDIRECITDVIVPRDFEDRVMSLLREYGVSPKVTLSET